jgi:predicted helicase
LAVNPSAKADAKKKLVAEFIDLDPTRISWTLSLKNRLAGLRPLTFEAANIVPATYRPFFRQYAYFDAGLNHIRGQSPRFFPLRTTRTSDLSSPVCRLMRRSA